MNIIKDLCKIIDCNVSKFLYNGFDNTLTELDSILQKSLNDKNGIYFNECLTNVFCEYDIDDIKLKLNNRLSHAVIGLTDNCNLRCKYCGYQDTRYKKSNSLKDMDELTLKSALDFIISHSIDSYETTITFYGGESLLRFDLIKFTIEYLEDKNYRGHKYDYHITTNGTLLDLEVINYLASKDVKCAVSLDGPVFINDRYRVYKGGNPSYVDVIKNLKNIARFFPKYYENNIDFQAVVSPPYDRSIPKDYFEKSRVRFINVTIGDYFSKLLKNEYGLALNGLEIKKAMPLYMGDMSKDELIKNRVYISSLKKYMNIGEKHIGNSIFPSGFCVPLVKRIFITADGKIVLCERVDEDNPLFQLGDVAAGYDFEKINLLYKNVNSILAKNCNKCWAFRFCNACFASLNLVKYNGDFCKLIRYEIEQDLINFLEFKFNNKRFVEIMQAISIG
ncbi:MAG: radical SAM protein [Tannerellaceae bacterium]|jgi:uncharacterized protein|nr:radical SAM protein [Tannerellaceae bacterium]